MDDNYWWVCLSNNALLVLDCYQKKKKMCLLVEEKVRHSMEIQCSEIIEWLPHSLAYFFRTVLLSLGHNQRIIHDFWKQHSNYYYEVFRAPRVFLLH